MREPRIQHLKEHLVYSREPYKQFKAARSAISNSASLPSLFQRVRAQRRIIAPRLPHAHHCRCATCMPKKRNTRKKKAQVVEEEAPQQPGVADQVGAYAGESSDGESDGHDDTHAAVVEDGAGSGEDAVLSEEENQSHDSGVEDSQDSGTEDSQDSGADDNARSPDRAVCSPRAQDDQASEDGEELEQAVDGDATPKASRVQGHAADEPEVNDPENTAEMYSQRALQLMGLSVRQYDLSLSNSLISASVLRPTMTAEELAELPDLYNAALDAVTAGDSKKRKLTGLGPPPFHRRIASSSAARDAPSNPRVPRALSTGQPQQSTSGVEPLPAQLAAPMLTSAKATAPDDLHLANTAGRARNTLTAPPPATTGPDAPEVPLEPQPAPPGLQDAPPAGPQTTPTTALPAGSTAVPSTAGVETPPAAPTNAPAAPQARQQAQLQPQQQPSPDAASTAPQGADAASSKSTPLVKANGGTGSKPPQSGSDDIFKGLDVPIQMDQLWREVQAATGGPPSPAVSPPPPISPFGGAQSLPGSPVTSRAEKVHMRPPATLPARPTVQRDPAAAKSTPAPSTVASAQNSEQTLEPFTVDDIQRAVDEYDSDADEQERADAEEAATMLPADLPNITSQHVVTAFTAVMQMLHREGKEPHLEYLSAFLQIESTILLAGSRSEYDNNPALGAVYSTYFGRDFLTHKLCVTPATALERFRSHVQNNAHNNDADRTAIAAGQPPAGTRMSMLAPVPPGTPSMSSLFIPTRAVETSGAGSSSNAMNAGPSRAGSSAPRNKKKKSSTPAVELAADGEETQPDDDSDEPAPLARVPIVPGKVTIYTPIHGTRKMMSIILDYDQRIPPTIDYTLTFTAEEKVLAVNKFVALLSFGSELLTLHSVVYAASSAASAPVDAPRDATPALPPSPDGDVGDSDDETRLAPVQEAPALEPGPAKRTAPAKETAPAKKSVSAKKSASAKKTAPSTTLVHPALTPEDIAELRRKADEASERRRQLSYLEIGSDEEQETAAPQDGPAAAASEDVASAVTNTGATGARTKRKNTAGAATRTSPRKQGKVSAAAAADSGEEASETEQFMHQNHRDRCPRNTQGRRW
ncbi:hypothetical protein AURDEDRAFT_124892 [Auricularia subglabra TFB-10046 SS5]|nr:hypothetical protein AURDEDRAFT_124892 [Auricularia subglabra TFB-10046 SS5]